MSSDAAQVEYLTFAEAAKDLPGRPDSTTIWRWARRGLTSRSGEIVCLDHVRIGGRLLTTKPWLDAFFKAVATSDMKHVVQEQPTEPSPAHQEADEELEAEGM